MYRFACLSLMILACLPSGLRADDASASSKSELAGLLGAEESDGFARAIEPREFSFPADHGPHEAFRNEWWYFTGNLDGEDGRRFGFELTIFRFSLSPEPASKTDVNLAANAEDQRIAAPPPTADRPAQLDGTDAGNNRTDESNRPSAWRTNQVYIAHFAVTDVEGDRFYAVEKSARGTLGLAGAVADPFHVWIDDWEIQGVDDKVWVLRAGHDDFAVDLELTALKSPVLNGVNGLSQKSDAPGNASYYYSMTRWQTRGTVRIGDDLHNVTGSSWLDREWSSSALASDQQGWDWFALQLEDGTELMYYGLRKTDGTEDASSAGTWVDADGASQKLAPNQVAVEVTRLWESPDGGIYPAGWRIEIEGKGLVLDVTPVIDDQELSTIVRYWEGAVDVSGMRNGEPVEGRGYVELTGYAEDPAGN